jgi:hypothetical protein
MQAKKKDIARQHNIVFVKKKSETILSLIFFSIHFSFFGVHFSFSGMHSTFIGMNFTF